MTPSNTPITPEIKDIADNKGDKHTVIPSNHTHEMYEVEGLLDSLSAKSNKITSGSPSGAIVTVNTTGTLSRSTKTVQDLLDAIDAKANTADVTTALAGKMDNKTIESTPTYGSNNLVTSGGVKAALNQKLDLDAIGIEYSIEYGQNDINLDFYFQTNEKQRTLLVQNLSQDDTEVNEVFHSQNHNIYFNKAGMTFPDLSYMIVRAYLADNKYFLICELCNEQQY